MDLIVENVSCSRGGMRVLAGVSFRLTAGQALVLRGPNGIGKTTLLRTIAGLQPASDGSIAAPDDSIAYAGHADGLKGALTVRQNLNFWAQVYGTQDIEPAMEAFELHDLAERQAQDLSAGQKRRLGLARMRVTDRSIWIFDEPTVSLDANNVALFADMVAGHLDRGGMALMATHIELTVPAEVLDLTPFKATQTAGEPFLDEAFL